MALLVIATLAACSAGHSDFEILFPQPDTGLSLAEQAAVFAIVTSWFPLSPDGSNFTDPNCGAVPVEAAATDLNGDGTLEVFVQWGNACTSGMTGRSLALLTKGADGQYRQQLGFPASGWTVLETGNHDWPDLVFGGPGFCHGVWAWSDGNYDFKCNLPETPGGCETLGNTCEPQ